MKPIGYLDLANDLVTRVKGAGCLPGTAGEAECRSAISRAYYAAFLVAQDFLGFLGIAVPDSGKCHVLVKDGLHNSGDLALTSASSQLGTLYAERRRADYKMNDTRPERVSQAEAMATLSQKTIALLHKQETECGTNASKKAAIADAILKWAQLGSQPLTKK